MPRTHPSLKIRLEVPRNPYLVHVGVTFAPFWVVLRYLGRTVELSHTWSHLIFPGQRGRTVGISVLQPRSLPGRHSRHSSSAATHRAPPFKGDVVTAATFGSYLSPVVLILPRRPIRELLGRFEKADAGVRGPRCYAACDKRHCGLARGKLLFAVLNQNIL